ncbi:hypothetical protein PPYR_04287 [Photinus pyralis]|uniref:Coiled-coil domain-containing protein n=3 Tax=Photinus pyralis TaxID=7054 RepID=A0A5N4AXM4_PHOPY|nr:hypothetical protein PPYR_04287 [Photinus pyralis]
MSTESIANVRTFMNGAVSIESTTTLTANEKPRKRISCSYSNAQLCENADASSFSSESSLLDERPSTTPSKSLASTPNLLNGMGLEQLKSLKAKRAEEKKREENRIRLEKQRQNFKRWLANKKDEEEKERISKEKMTKHQSEKDYEKQRRQKEAELKYKLWCKRKEQEELEKKLKAKIDEIKSSEDHDRRTERNQTAYQNWLKNSVYKPMPIPLNRGLETLRSSASVTYINPIPWQPNIDESCLNSQK